MPPFRIFLLSPAFCFLSGLYFRGNLACAERFARPPAGAHGVQVITTDRGLLPGDAPVGVEDLRRFVVLLGSVTTSKHMDVLLKG